MTNVFERCPGCGHNYGWGFTEKSVANENGYCGWCVDEGIHSKESYADMHALWAKEGEARRIQEEKEYQEKYGENGDNWF
jgi:hypothetical protein